MPPAEFHPSEVNVCPSPAGAVRTRRHVRNRHPDETGGAPKQIGALSHIERRVIHLLRAYMFPEKDGYPGQAACLATAPALNDALAGLAAEVHANKLAVFAPNSAFVSSDEMTILNRLMLLQRPSRTGHWQLTGAFQIALKLCASELEREGRRLPARPLRDSLASRQDCFEIRLSDAARPCVPRGRRVRLWDGRTEPEPGTLRAKALEIVRGNELAATAQFLSAGITQQYLFWLNRHGYVEKVGHGFYRFPVHHCDNM